MSFLLELRDAAKRCSHKEWKRACINVADALSPTIDAFVFAPTEENLRDLNGCWARAARVLKRMPPEVTPDPIGGDTEAARLAA